MKRFKSVVVGAVGGLMLLASNAHAALDFTGFSLNTTDVELIMGFVITGLAALWGYRKVVKSMNRS